MKLDRPLLSEVTETVLTLLRAVVFVFIVIPQMPILSQEKSSLCD